VPRTEAISDQLHDRLFEAFFSETLKADTAARENADRAFAVASAVAAALVAAGVVIDIRSRSWWVQAAGVAALALWLAAAYAFIRAVSHSTYPVGATKVGNDQWGNLTIEQALTTRREVYDKLRAAGQWSGAAGLVTLIALVLALVDRHDETRHATLTLHRDGAAGLRLLCPDASALEGTVKLSSLDNEFVRITLPPGTCGTGSHTLRIDRSDVVGILTK
jgi:hypothetical protein